MCKLLGIKINASKTKEQLKNLIKNYETSKKVSIVRSDEDCVIKYVYHLADIHIRSLERHPEYIQVFENLYCYLKSQENLNESVLIIAGDIFHSKDKLVPESIAVFNDLVTNLTSILPVCMIAGNHDAFANSNRVDVISGITDIKKFDNLHFFKNSGIYKYNNINFVVSSVIQSDTLTDAPDLSDECRNIGLYHGIVSNSKTDSGTSLTSNVNTSDFKNLDIVMLGDIHKRQFLTPTIAYCGSLVQQNHGENLTEHGLIKWNILDKTSECVNIKNDYGYVTISPDFSEDTFFPKNSRVRVRHPYDYDLNIEKVKERLANYTTVLSVSKEILQDYSVQQINVDEEEKCKDYLLSSLLTKFDTITKQKILDLHSNYKQEYSGENNLEVLPWKINYIEFKNIFIYGGDILNRVSLDSGITGIIGKNASGKTSFLNIIIYALFGNVFKTKNFSNRNIINRNSKNFYLKMSIALAGEELLIEKQGKIKSRGIFTGMDETLVFSKKTAEGEVVQLNAGNKIETMKKIFDTLGLTTKENFILTNVVSYANYVSLLNHSSADITKTFAQLFDILVYKNIHSDVLKKHKSLSTVVGCNIEKMKKLEQTIASDTIVERVSEETVREANDSLEATNFELESTLLKTVDLGDFDEGLILKEQDYVKIVQDFDESNPFADLEIQVLQKQKKACSTPKSYISYNSEIIVDLEEELKQILTAPEEPCTRETYDNLTNNQRDFLEKLDVLFKEVWDSDTVSLPKSLFLDIKKHFENPKNTLLVLHYNNYLKDVKIYNDKIQERKKKTVLLNDYYCAKNKLLDEAILYKDAKTNLEKIHLFKKDLLSKKKIIQLKELRTVQTSKILSLTKTVTQTRIHDEFVKKSKEELIILRAENDALQQEITTLSYYKDVLLLLPKMILTDKIKKIEMECNVLCYRLIGLTINLDTYAEADSPETKYEITAKKASGSIIGIDQISGFERFVVNVALKLALDKYKCQSGAKIFCIDEAFDCISAENFDKIDELFEYLKQYYKTVLVVSHNDELKKKIDKSINIIVGDTFSSISST